MRAVHFLQRELQVYEIDYSIIKFILSKVTLVYYQYELDYNLFFSFLDHFLAAINNAECAVWCDSRHKLLAYKKRVSMIDIHRNPMIVINKIVENYIAARQTRPPALLQIEW